MLRIFKFGIIVCFLAFASPIHGVENPQTLQVTVSATVGEPKLTVFGWTSPKSLVELKGQGVSDLAIADSNGYFLFDRVFLPARRSPAPKTLRESPFGHSRSDPTELCLTTIDRSSRLSAFPTCLPPLPSGPFEIRVGPVLLPPTLSLEKGNFLPGEQIKATGATFPNSKVTVFLADERRGRHLGGEIISKAHARFLPQYEIKSDKNGNFEFNLPAGTPNNWKVFTSAEFQGSPSPKSNTLSFRVLSWWDWFWLKARAFFLAVFAFFKPNWWLLV
ncbi:MAG: hypothetical protein ACPLXP_03490, partial [Microgenomates group bacterium]